ncbi:MAG TPA: aromatic amino acid ammonia-lyase [Polyangia bacterium]|nr:aromatic amino acid ammonia-lyase [Polyangia bacterium]
MSARDVIFGPAPISIDDVSAIAAGAAAVALSTDAPFRARIDASRASLERQLAAGRTIYGVTTGVGESCETVVPLPRTGEVSANLLRFHGCGTGAPLTDEESAAVVAARLASLCRGHSGVRAVVLERLADLLRHRILPRIPSEGSVGASGDLTPLSYVAAVLTGEREVSLRGEVIPARAALERCGLAPIELRPKEALSLMNGTSMMTGLACVAFGRARALARLAASLSAMASDVLRGNASHFDARIFALKPHPGQAACAAWMRAHLGDVTRPGTRVQDRYSLRCAPHVIGVLLDALAMFRPMLETELNSVNDNPIVDAERDEILHGGNFYGGHVAFAMDGLKAAVANVADLLDRQLVMLCNPATNAGLPADLVAPEAGPTHHGFKAMQIGASALTAEALKLTMPASVFSRSTESHNQDKVSMGSIAARDCQRVLELTETVAAVELLALCQAVDLRGPAECTPGSRALHAAVRRLVPRNDADRRQDVDIAKVLETHRAGALPVGAADFA